MHFIVANREIATQISCVPRIIPSSELDAIAAIVSQHPAGIGVDQIRGSMSMPLPPRTLQRRLQQLEQEQRIRSKGFSKGKRYLPAWPEMEPTLVLREEETPAIPHKTESDHIPLSAEAREVLTLIRRPIAERLPVAYNAKFLNSYIPNKTFYLTNEMREELARLGQVGISHLPAGTYLRQVMNRLLIDLSWNSSRLEGNTYSLLETERLLAAGEAVEGKRFEETQMILNHKAAIEMLADQADEIAFNRYTICNLHAVLADNLLFDRNASGRVRSRGVGITGTVYQPLHVPQRIEEYFEEILTKAEMILDPYEQSFFAMVHFPYLQPFEDVNKRVSRLAANIPLIRRNLCPLAFVDVPQRDYIHGVIGVYELNRIEYLRDVFLWAYRRSATRYGAVLQTIGEPDPFRLRYRAQIGELTRSVVMAPMDKGRAARWIAEQARTLMSGAERERFILEVEEELSSLHIGNIARHRLRPGEFRVWQEQWR